MLTSLGTEDNSFVFASLGPDFTLLALFTLSPFVFLPGPPCPGPKLTPKTGRWERNSLTDKAFPHEVTSTVSLLTKGEWDGDFSIGGSQRHLPGLFKVKLGPGQLLEQTSMAAHSQLQLQPPFIQAAFLP